MAAKGGEDLENLEEMSALARYVVAGGIKTMRVATQREGAAKEPLLTHEFKALFNSLNTVNERINTDLLPRKIFSGQCPITANTCHRRIQMIQARLHVFELNVHLRAHVGSVRTKRRELFNDDVVYVLHRMSLLGNVDSIATGDGTRSHSRYATSLAIFGRLTLPAA